MSILKSHSLSRIEGNLFNLFIGSVIFAMFNREFLFWGEDSRLVVVLFGGLLGLVNVVRLMRERGNIASTSFAQGNLALIAYFFFAIAGNVVWFHSDLQLIQNQFYKVFIANGINLYVLILVVMNQRYIEWRSISRMVIASGTFLFLSMLVVLGGGDLQGYWSEYEGGYSDGISRSLFSDFRYAGYAEDPNFASFFMVVFALCAILLARKGGNRIYYAFVPVAIFGLLIAMSKSVIAMIVIALCMVGLLRWRKVSVVLREGLLLAVFVLSILATQPQLLHLPTMTLSLRSQLWHNAMAVFPGGPIFGRGLTSARSANLFVDWAVQIHSSIIQTLVEVGIVGLVILYFAIRLLLQSSQHWVVFIAVVFLGTFATYETMNHLFSVFVMGVIPLVARTVPTDNLPPASVYVINTISHGGAERVVQTMANNARPGERVYIYTMEKLKGTEYDLDESIKIKTIGGGTSKIWVLLKAWLLSVELEHVFSTHSVTLATTHLPLSNLVVRLSGYSPKFIYVNHGMVGISHAGFSGKMVRFMYNRQRTVAVSEELLQDELRGNFGVYSGVMDYVYNPIDFAQINSMRVPHLQRTKQIITMGRLSPEKMPLTAITTFLESGLAAQGYTLEMFGTGPMRKEIAAYIKSEGLGDRVFLRGFTENPYREMQQAACLMHASNYESFGMAIVEALYMQCPVVAFDIQFGIREVMPGRLRNYLAPKFETAAMAENLQRAVTQPYPLADATQIMYQLSPTYAMQRYYELYEEWVINDDVEAHV